MKIRTTSITEKCPLIFLPPCSAFKIKKNGSLLIKGDQCGERDNMFFCLDLKHKKFTLVNSQTQVYLYNLEIIAQQKPCNL